MISSGAEFAYRRPGYPRRHARSRRSGPVRPPERCPPVI